MEPPGASRILRHLAFVSAAVVGLLACPATSNALDDYVAKQDGHYSYYDTGLRMEGESPRNGVLTPWKGYVLNMTSQSWLTPADSSRPVWWHMLVVIEPDIVSHEDRGMLWITGGDNDGSGIIPSATDEDIKVAANLAVNLGMVCAALFQVPNQHIVFNGDPLAKQRTEDSLVAYGWAHFLDFPDVPEWLLLFPMTKAAVKAMDTAEDFVKRSDEVGLHSSIEKWGVAGASKRGWTTWLTTAVATDRVMFAAPVVFDELNFTHNLHHHYQAYGGWSWALQDYYDMNLTARFDDPAMDIFNSLIDPLSYKDRFANGRIPLLVVDCGMDEFFLPDDQRWWWDDMASTDIHMIMAPNTEHSFATGILEVLPSVAAWANAHMHGQVVPVPTWTIDEEPDGGKITVVTGAGANGAPGIKAVSMWHATSCAKENRRDFRIATADDPCTCGVAAEGQCVNTAVVWHKTRLNATADGSYVAEMASPPDGQWTAFFVDMIYESTQLGWPVGRPGEMEFTTEVSIVPNTFPAPPCEGAGCKGTIV